jgi:hypothetical protein
MLIMMEYFSLWRLKANKKIIAQIIFFHFLAFERVRKISI